MTLYLSNGAIEEILSIKSIFVLSGGESSSINIYNKKNGPLILELLQLENNHADLYDGEDRMQFIFLDSAIQSATKTNKLKSGSILIIDEILVSKNQEKIEISNFFIIGSTEKCSYLIGNEKKTIENQINSVSDSDVNNNLKRKRSDEIEDEIEDEIIVKKPKNSSCTHNLSSITSDLKNWSCILKLIKKTGLLKSKSGIDIIKFQLSDEIKSIEAISFGQDALNHEKELQIGHIYYIENAKIGLSNSSLKTWSSNNNSEFYLTLNKLTKITVNAAIKVKI